MPHDFDGIACDIIRMLVADAAFEILTKDASSDPSDTVKMGPGPGWWAYGKSGGSVGIKVKDGTGVVFKNNKVIK